MLLIDYLETRCDFHVLLNEEQEADTVQSLVILLLLLLLLSSLDTSAKSPLAFKASMDTFSSLANDISVYRYIT